MSTTVSKVIEDKVGVALRARRRDGLGAVIRLIGRSAVDHLIRAAVRRRNADFDLRHGVDTVRGLGTGELDHARSRYCDGNSYAAVPIHQMEKVFRALSVSSTTPSSEFAFVDLGCGKGLPLMVAIAHGFTPVIGVELDSRLAEIARRNMAAYTTSSGIRNGVVEVLEQDAVEFEFPCNPTLVFMYNPFGPQTLRAVLDRASASVSQCPRPFFVAYYNMIHREVLDIHPALKLVRRTVRWSLYAVEANVQ